MPREKVYGKKDGQRAMEAVRKLFEPATLAAAHKQMTQLGVEELRRQEEEVLKAGGASTMIHLGDSAVGSHVEKLISILGKDRYVEAQREMERFGHPETINAMLETFLTGAYTTAAQAFSKSRQSRFEHKSVPTLTSFGLEMKPPAEPTRMQRIALEQTAEQVKIDEARHRLAAAELGHQMALLNYDIQAKTEEDGDKREELLAKRNTMFKWLHEDSERRGQLDDKVATNLLVAVVRQALAAQRVILVLTPTKDPAA